MADISKITVGESEYNLKDAGARSLIAGLGTPMRFVGSSTSALTDGGNENINDGEAPYTGKAGDVVIYEKKEFVWDGEKWSEFGELTGVEGTLGALAYQDKGSVVPKGTIAIGAITPTGMITPGAITVAEQTATSSFTGSASAVTGTAKIAEAEGLTGLTATFAGGGNNP